MDFTKAHGTGNDFVVFADMHDALDLPVALVQALTDRRFGIGGDGVLRIGAPQTGGDVFMDYRNADGSIVEMCGNGVRVVAKFAFDHGLIASDRDSLVVETRAGHRDVHVERDAAGCVVRATVDMGPASFAPSSVPFLNGDDVADYHTVSVEGASVELAVASMGNPHAVIIVDDVDTAPVLQLGTALQEHPQFPEQVNVGFVHVDGPSAVRLRVFERGVGETASCGTGACAAVAVLHRDNKVGAVVDVSLPGGTLTVDVRDGNARMTGAVEEVARGTIDRAWLTARRQAVIDGT